MPRACLVEHYSGLIFKLIPLFWSLTKGSIFCRNILVIICATSGPGVRFIQKIAQGDHKKYLAAPGRKWR